MNEVWLALITAFSILPSDRTTCTYGDEYGAGDVGGDVLSVSYPRIEPPAPLMGIMTGVTATSFQYPTLGSNHLHQRRCHR